MLLGVVCGLFLGELARPLALVGEGFMMLLKMSVLPYITCALIRGMGGLRPREALSLLRCGGLALLIIWAITLTTLFALTLIFPKESVPAYHNPGGITPINPNELIALFIPSNPFHALANNIIPAVVLFSTFFGVALMTLKEKEQILSMLDLCVEGLNKINRWAVNISPIGIFALIAATVGTMTRQQFELIQIYLYGFIAASLLLTFWILPMLITSLTRVRYFDLMRELQSGLLLSFATGNIFVAIPNLIAAIQRIAHRPGINVVEVDQSASTLVPIAYNLPLVGNLMSIYFIFFLSYLYAIPLTFGEEIKLIIVSIFSLVGPVTGAANSISLLISALHFPSDGLLLFNETAPLTRNLQGLAGAMGISVFTLFAIFAHHKRLHFRPFAILRELSIALATLAGFILLINLGELNLRFPQPILMTLQIESTVSATLQEAPLPPRKLAEGESLFDAIKRSGTVRVGFNPNPIPFAYFNDQGNLVGYDIAFAYNLAESLGLSIDFIPFEMDQLEELLNSGSIDIAMSGLAVTTDRLQRIGFSNSYMTSRMAFVVPEEERQQFDHLSKVVEMEGVRMGVLRGSALEEVAMRLFPQAVIVPLDSYESALPEGQVELYLWGEQQAASWSILHSNYTAVVPTPDSEKALLGWAVPAKEEEWLSYINYWSELRKLDGFASQEEQKWIFGVVPEEKPRWSILSRVRDRLSRQHLPQADLQH